MDGYFFGAIKFSFTKFLQIHLEFRTKLYYARKNKQIKDCKMTEIVKNTQNKPTKRLKSDALFKSMMTETLVAKEFLEEYLPLEIKQMLDLTQIKIEPESFVEDDLTRQLSDIVYSVKMLDSAEQSFIYVLAEHQSQPCHYMALRLLKYTTLLLERHAKNQEKLPLVFPIVFYTGKKKYLAPRNLWDLFERPDFAKSILRYLYQNPFQIGRMNLKARVRSL